VTVTAVARLRRLTPSLDRLLHYQRGWLRGDVLAGVTVAAYLVPQCMAYGELAGLEPVVGLWAILPALGIYAVLGSS
jgi:sulfate permease, SulP family